jgi:rhodanese-related sulfurtransferase
MNTKVDLPTAREVCPTTTQRLIGQGALLVDVRERAEIDRLAFDVPDIVALPMSELEQRYAELPRDRELVIVCQVGARSLKATYFLMFQGYTRVANMEGGLDKWVRKGFPVKGDASQAAAMVMGGSCCGGAPATAAATPASCCAPSASSGACC